MAFQYTSGNPTVDSVGMVQFRGNIIPQEWYKQILRENGKPYLLAIVILSDIVYWYRPTEVRDEYTGEVIRWQKRFADDYLQKSYQQYAIQFGESKRSVKAAIDCLENLQIVSKFFRDLEFENSPTLYNVMYIRLNVEKLLEISFPDNSTERRESVGIRRGGKVVGERDNKLHARVGDNSCENGENLEPNNWDNADSEDNDGNTAEVKSESGACVYRNPDDVTLIKENESGADSFSEETNTDSPTYKILQVGPADDAGYPTKFCKMVSPDEQGDPTKFCRRVLQNNVGGPTEFCGRVLQNNVGGPTKFCGTNTKTTTETTAKITSEITTEINSQDMDGLINHSIYHESRTGETVKGQETGIPFGGSNSDLMMKSGSSESALFVKSDNHGDVDRIRNDLAQIRKNIRYDELMIYWGKRGPEFDSRRQRFQALYDLISEVICVRAEYVRISGKDYPWFHLEERFLRLTDEHLTYVMECMDRHKGKIGNIKNYLLMSLYNAPATMEDYETQAAKLWYLEGVVN